jgi:hypothetical protein
MKWENLSEKTRFWMKELGNFNPTVQNTTLKGYMWDDDCGHGVKTYLNRQDLIEISQACLEVAEFIKGEQQ